MYPNYISQGQWSDPLLLDTTFTPADGDDIVYACYPTLQNQMVITSTLINIYAFLLYYTAFLL